MSLQHIMPKFTTGSLILQTQDLLMGEGLVGAKGVGQGAATGILRCRFSPTPGTSVEGSKPEVEHETCLTWPGLCCSAPSSG